MKVKKAIIKKNNVEFVLINPEKDIPIDRLCSLFGTNTIKVNFQGLGIFEIEGLNGNQERLGTLENITNLDWTDITI